MLVRFQDLVLFLRDECSHKLLFHRIFCLLLYGDRGNSFTLHSRPNRSSRFLRTRLDFDLYFGEKSKIIQKFYKSYYLKISKTWLSFR